MFLFITMATKGAATRVELERPLHPVYRCSREKETVLQRLGKRGPRLHSVAVHGRANTASNKGLRRGKHTATEICVSNNMRRVVNFLMNRPKSSKQTELFEADDDTIWSY